MKKYKLEWYVLNDCSDNRGGCEIVFKEYPYPSGQIKPFNVFNNYGFREAAIELAKNYYNGKFTLKTLRKNNMETPYDYKTNTFGKPYVKEEIIKLKNNFDAFEYQLMKQLQYEEWSRCEYEILVTTLFGNNGNDVFQKIDTYTQVLPNARIFAEYVLRAVNGTVLTKEQKNRKKVSNHEK